MKTRGKAYLNKPNVSMKKLILMLVVLMGVIVDVSAGIKLGGIEVHVERGRKEWNADKTATFCVGKGICIFTIKANVDIGAAKSHYEPGSGLLSFDNNKLALVLSESCLRDSYWSDLFVNGQLYVGATIDLDPRIREKFGPNCPRQILAGNYNIQRNDGLLVIYF